MILSSVIISFSNMDDFRVSTTGLVSSFLSEIGSLIVIITYCKYKSLRTFQSRLVVCLSIANIIWTAMIICNLINSLITQTAFTGAACIVTAVFLQWFIVSESLWVMLIAIHLFFCIVRMGKGLENRPYTLLAVG